MFQILMVVSAEQVARDLSRASQRSKRRRSRVHSLCVGRDERLDEVARVRLELCSRLQVRERHARRDGPDVDHSLSGKSALSWPFSLVGLTR